MDKDDRSSGGLPGGGLIVVALLAIGALYVSKAPLETSRPATVEPRLERSEAPQDIDARLWQDPFGAVSKARELALKLAGGLKEDQKRHSERRFADELQRQAGAGGSAGAVVVAVMLPGGPYVEQAESRRRTRYAVLAGLKARGFVPSDGEHLGYFYPYEGEGVHYGLPETVPFESFDTEPDARVCSGCRLIVLWLDSSAFHDQPLLKLATLAQRSESSGQPIAGDAPKVRWRVMGPSSSDGLRAVIDETASEKFHADGLRRFDFRFFSGAATAPDAALLRPVKAPSNTTVSAYLETRGVRLLRTIGTDDLLAGALVKELELRGLRTRPLNGGKVRCPDADSESDAAPEDLPSSIAIVSEGDTLYGRALRQQFRYNADAERPGFCVTRWLYFRGLDGRLPGEAAPQALDSRTKKDAKTDTTEGIGREGSYIERPEGPSQFDYLRRLANRIREEDAALRKRQGGREFGIRAIGVLGSDVYDKLLILQALQSEMPHAIFFTTDLDARLFHPREQAWARNLIVVSNFGLRLANPLQRDIAPFRDSYQTSAYLSTLLLIADVDSVTSPGGEAKPSWNQSQISPWFEQPRLFEVSRSGAFDFSKPYYGARGPASPAPNSATYQVASRVPVPVSEGPMPRCTRRALENCSAIHPGGSEMWPSLPFAAHFLIFGALSLTLWVPALALSRNGKRRVRRFVAAGGHGAHSRMLRLGALAVVFAMLAVGLPLLLARIWPYVADWITQDGKPLSFTNGISPWPTYLIRLATSVLCAYFVWRAWSSLASNVDRIAREFRLGATRRHFNALLSSKEQKLSLWQRLVSMLSVRFYSERVEPLSVDQTAMTTKTETFWMHYIVQNRASARLLRTTLFVVAMMALSVLVNLALGDAPIAPQRGTLTKWMQPLSTWLTGPPALFLIFFVADATVLCVFFMRGLRLHRANWPERTLQGFQARLGVPARFLDDWIDLEFIVHRTRCVGALIYYPFIVLSLMLLARSAFFDDWYTSPTVAVLSTLSFAIVLACALALRRSAEASRSQALVRLRDAILHAKGEAGNSALVSQLEALRDRVERLRDGAFAPYLQQPLLKAVLLPFLTFGGSSLFDYLALANL